MIKKFFLTLTVFATSLVLNAQTWGTYGTGVPKTGYILGIADYSGNLYVDGYFTSAGGNPANNIAQWNGTTWSSVGSGINSYGNCMANYAGKLIAGGWFDSAGGVAVKNIAQWNGSIWSALGAGVDTTVNTMAVYNGNLYVGGSIISAGGNPVNNIAQWNGSTWASVGRGITDSTPGYIEVKAMAVYNGELYVAGLFDSAGGVPVSNIAKWNGTTWSAVGRGITGNTYPWSTYVSALCVFDGELYAGGAFDSAGGIAVKNIAKWNGTTWSAVGGGVSISGSPSVGTLYVTNHELYAGGNFTTAGTASANFVAQWDGNKWYSMTTGITGSSTAIACLGGYNSALVVGGQFGYAGGTTCNDIAYWIGGPPSATEICYVTVDTASKYNEVLWDKTGVDTNLVDSVRIYSKGFSVYQYIGHVSIHNFTQFVDSSSHPNTVSSYYEISTVDTSGLVSQLSAYNQTILLQASLGVGNVVNLSWNAYQGDSVNYYVILRDSAGANNWQRLDSVSNTTFAYTDNHPPVSANLRYMIITVWSLNCVPYSNSPIVRHQAMSANQVSSRSNRKQIVVSGVPTVSAIPSVNIYPNPSKDIVTIALSQPEDAIITLNNILGQAIYTDKLNGNENVKQLNLSEVKDGVYFLKITMSNGGEMVRKIEIVR